MELPEGKWMLKAEKKDKRSNQQNRYYWGCVIPLVKEGLREAGYDDIKTDEHAHEVLKHLFLKKEIKNNNTDEVIQLSKSTTELNKLEFNEFIEEVAMWASSYLSIVIPEPGKQTEIWNSQ